MAQPIIYDPQVETMSYTQELRARMMMQGLYHQPSRHHDRQTQITQRLMFWAFIAGIVCGLSI